MRACYEVVPGGKDDLYPNINELRGTRQSGGPKTVVEMLEYRFLGAVSHAKPHPYASPMTNGFK
jgi:hypothetical protein